MWRPHVTFHGTRLSLGPSKAESRKQKAVIAQTFLGLRVRILSGSCSRLPRERVALPRKEKNRKPKGPRYPFLKGPSPVVPSQHSNLAGRAQFVMRAAPLNATRDPSYDKID